MRIEDLSAGELALVDNCPLFVGTGYAKRAVSSESCTLKLFGDGETVSDGGAALVLSGSVRARTSSGKHKLSLRMLLPGSLFGVSALFSEEGYATELCSVGSSRVLFFEQSLLEELMQEDFALAKNYIRFLSGRVRFLNRKIACLSAGTTDAMLALYLLESEDGLYVDSFSGLAEGLGVGRASLYRALDKLELKGYISRSLHGINILDRNGLEKLLQ